MCLLTDHPSWMTIYSIRIYEYVYIFMTVFSSIWKNYGALVLNVYCICSNVGTAVSKQENNSVRYPRDFIKQCSERCALLCDLVSSTFPSGFSHNSLTLR